MLIVFESITLANKYIELKSEKSTDKSNMRMSGPWGSAFHIQPYLVIEELQTKPCLSDSSCVSSVMCVLLFIHAFPCTLQIF